MRFNTLEIIVFLLPFAILFTAFALPEPRRVLWLRLVGAVVVVWILLVIDRHIQNPIEAARGQARGDTDFDPSWGNLGSIIFGWIPASIITAIALLVRFLWFGYVRT